jgi:hypothetical protein
MISCKFTQTPFLFLEFQLSNSSAILYNAFYGGRMHFVDEFRVNSLVMTYTEKKKTIKFIEDIVFDSPDVIRVTIN